MLFDILDFVYLSLCANETNDQYRLSVRFILEHKIIHGDALSLITVKDGSRHIIFSEWSPVKGSFIKRRDFTFTELIACGADEANFERGEKLNLFSDFGADVFIPTPIKKYPLTHFMELAYADEP